MEKVEGKSFTSNHVKLLKHMDKLKIIQDGGRPSPVMFHMSPCNPCNLTCSFCCFANRAMKEMLTVEQMKKAIDSFKHLGVTGMEFSVRGDEIIPYKDSNGMLRIDTIKDVVDNKIEATSFSLDENNKFIEDKITAFYAHPQTEPMYKVTLDGGRYVTTTGSHSICFWENEQVIKKKVKDAEVGDKVVLINAKPEVKIINEITYNDKTYVIDKDFSRFLGYFVAEGSYNVAKTEDNESFNQVIFTFGPYEDEFEKKFIDDVESIAKKIDGVVPYVHPSTVSNKTSIRIHNHKFTNFINSLNVGRRAQSKRVPDIIFNLSDDCKIEFLKGIYAGDGNFRSTAYKGGNYNRNVLSYKTSSKAMTRTLSYLLDSLDVHHTLTEGINKERMLEGRILAPSPYYVVSISLKPSLEKLSSVIEFIGGELKYKNNQFSHAKSHINKTIISDDAYALKIKKIEKLEDIDEQVYDITVGKTNKFIGTYSVQFSNTGGGEPTLHPKLDEVVQYAYDAGLKIGICTNGTRLNKIKTWDKFAWVRLGMYGFDEGYEYDLSVFEGLDIKISAAYVWDIALETSNNPNITGKWIDDKGRKLSPSRQKEENFHRMIDWVEENKIPTRIAFNAIKPVEEVQKDIQRIKEILGDRELKYAFLSDFNFKGVRRNDHCYMHMVKPCVFTDGNVYVCPSAELAPENNYQVNDEFKICDIDGIIDYYESIKGGAGVSRRFHACSFCKYAMQNELVDDIVAKTDHNEFA